jgi:hypothetical protein
MFSKNLASRSGFQAPVIFFYSLPPEGGYGKKLEKSEVSMSSHAYQLNEDVHHQPQGPQGRSVVEGPKVYTIVKRMPIEADGRLRYRIKCKTDNVERIATEDQLSHCQ